MNQNKVRRALLGSIRATYALRQRKGNFSLWAGEVDRSRDLVFFWVTQRNEKLDHRSGGTTYSFPCPRRTKMPLPREIPPPCQKRASILPSPMPFTPTLSLQAKRYASPQPITLHGTVEYMPPSGMPPTPYPLGPRSLKPKTTTKKCNKPKKSRSPQAPGKVRLTNHSSRSGYGFTPIISLLKLLFYKCFIFNRLFYYKFIFMTTKAFYPPIMAPTSTSNHLQLFNYDYK